MASITYRIVVKAIPPCAHLFNDFPFFNKWIKKQGLLQIQEILMQMLWLKLEFLKVNDLELGKCYGHVHISLEKLRITERKSV